MRPKPLPGTKVHVILGNPTFQYPEFRLNKSVSNPMIVLLDIVLN